MRRAGILTGEMLGSISRWTSPWSRPTPLKMSLYLAMMLSRVNGATSGLLLPVSTTPWLRYGLRCADVLPVSVTECTAQMFYNLVGDDAFPLYSYLMKPYFRGHLSQEEHVTNYRISRARRTSENAFMSTCKRIPSISHSNLPRAKQSCKSCLVMLCFAQLLAI